MTTSGVLTVTVTAVGEVDCEGNKAYGVCVCVCVCVCV